MDTIKEIVKEMRGANFQPPMYQVWINEYADRIEAAHKREMADALDTGAFVEAARKLKVDVSVLDTTTKGNLGVGNTAKMREALEEILDCCKDSLGYNIAYVEDQARQALSAPPRNCDKFSKAEVLKVLDNCSFSKEDTIEWLYTKAEVCDGK